MLAFFAIDLLLLMLPTKLMITGHEGDLMHMADATLRMVNGELPHLDFMTPIGILGFAPVAWFLSLGLPLGKATLMADAAMLAVMLPFVWWLAVTRLSRGQGYYFGAVMVITMMAVVYGGGSNSISLSMYYNRWGWSFTFLILVTALFPPRRMLAEAWIAPLVIGLSMAALALIKMTFFVPLLVALPLILLAQKDGGLLLKSALVGAVAGGVVVGWLGVDFLWAYIDDLLVVMRPESARVSPGVNLMSLIANPNTIASSAILFVALVIFRKTGHMHQGLIVMILAPVFTYITYQNWGNDPKWLHLMVLYIWANLPDRDVKPVFGVAGRSGAIAVISAAVTIILPSIISMGISPIWVAGAGSTEGFSEFQMNDDTSDIWLPEHRMADIFGVQAVRGWPTLTPDLDPLEIEGRLFPDCKLSGATLIAQYSGMAQQIEAAEIAQNRPVLVADVLNFLWLISDLSRVQGAAPWYYGDESGLANAEFIAVPLCPAKPELRAAMMAEVETAGYGLTEVFSSELVVLYKLTKPAE